MEGVGCVIPHSVLASPASTCCCCETPYCEAAGHYPCNCQADGPSNVFGIADCGLRIADCWCGQGVGWVGDGRLLAYLWAVALAWRLAVLSRCLRVGELIVESVLWWLRGCGLGVRSGRGGPGGRGRDGFMGGSRRCRAGRGPGCSFGRRERGGFRLGGCGGA